MEDDELEKLREEKKQELQENQETREEQQEEMEKQVWEQAKQYMTSDAKDRLSNIKVADKRKALSVAQQIARMGETGRIKTVDDDQMKQILKSIENEKRESQSDIKFRR
ncbi:MAG: programmed cell death protein 5 [Candidatus Nanohaloarchaea archaeon]|jgi:programmed cell death protein 5